MRWTLLVVLFGCGGGADRPAGPIAPVAELGTAKAGYGGDWTGPGVTLHVGWDAVKYERKTEHTSNTVAGQLAQFVANDLVVDAGLLKARVAVDAPPTQKGDAWTMVVDGVPLTKTPGTNAASMYERGMFEHFKTNGANVAKVACDATKPPPVDCTLETDVGEKLVMHVTRTADAMAWEGDVALLDTKQLVDTLAAAAKEKAQLDVAVTCPTTKTIVKAVGSTFQCEGKTADGRALPMTITVKNKDGGVSYDF